MKTVIPGEPLASTAPSVRADGSILKDDMTDIFGSGSEQQDDRPPVGRDFYGALVLKFEVTCRRGRIVCCTFTNFPPGPWFNLVRGLTW